jgi:ankyrin repeat protein
VEHLQKALGLGLCINTQDAAGLTALHVAADLGFLGMVQFVLYTPGARVDVFEYATGCTLLHVCAMRGHYDCVVAFLNGSNAGGREQVRGLVRRPDQEGFTPLLHASAQGHTQVVQLFLELASKASSSLLPDALTPAAAVPPAAAPAKAAAVTASAAAAAAPVAAAGSVLVQADGTDSIVHGSISQVVNDLTSECKCVLHLAAMGGHADMMQLLLADKAVLVAEHLNRRDRVGLTPLWYSMQKDVVEVVAVSPG